MTKLKELIKKLCPNGVEYKALKDMCSEIIVPMRDRPKVFNGTIPWCRIEDKEGQFFNKSLSGLGVSEEVIKDMNLKVFPKGTVICSCSASLGAYAINTQPLITNQTFIGLVCGQDLLNKYLLYFMETQTAYLKAQASTGTIPYVSRKKFEEMMLPCPPLPIQEEIVRILDKFTTLTAELQVELQARRQQYEYYRDKLLTFGDDVPKVKLGNFSSIIRGGNFQKKDFIENGKPCIHYGQMYTHFGIYTDKVIKYLSEEVFNKSKQASKNDIVMAVTSENVEDVCSCTAWLGDDNIAISGHTAIIKHNQNAKYLSYYFHTSNFFHQKKKLAHGTKVIEITPNSLNDIIIPLPPLEEQERIVTILDRFDKLCNDITTGLPAEIEARQKQYEYYRDKLLTFKRKE